MSQPRGKFITFEGLDGSGKSTQIVKLAFALRARGVEVVLTREPGGTPLGESIRALLLDAKIQGMHADTELALMFASRAQLVAEVIRPALLRGSWIVCDRFVDSSEAYQGGGRRLGSEVVLDLHRTLLGGLMPDLTIFLDHEVARSIARARTRTLATEGKPSRFEEEGNQFFERVQKAFRQIAAREPARVFSTDAKRPVQEIHEDILAEVCSRFAPEFRPLADLLEAR
jgi:dTMP kinase